MDYSFIVMYCSVFFSMQQFIPDKTRGILNLFPAN